MDEDKLDLDVFDEAVTEAEQQVSDDLDLSVFDEAIIQEEGERMESPIGGGPLAAGLGLYATGSALESSEPALRDIAEKTAFGAVGGNRKLLEEYYKNPDQFINPKEIGRKALDEGLLVPSEKKIRRLQKEGRETVGEIDRLLEGVEGETDLRKVFERYQELANEAAPSELGDLDRKIREAVEGERELFKPTDGKPKTRTALELEREKRSMRFDPDSATPRRRAETLKRQALQETVEDLVKDAGLDEDQFKQLKKSAGMNKILDNLLSGKISEKDLRSGKIEYGDMLAEVLAPGGAVARRGVREYGQAALAKGADVASKASRFSGLLKKLGAAVPFLGAGATFAAEREEGKTPLQAAGIAAAEEITDLAGPIKEIIRPEAAGPQRGSLAEKLESGQALTNEEQKELKASTTGERMSPERIRELQERLRELNKPSAEIFAEDLENLKSDDPEEKAQAQFKLAQQPAYKEYIKRFIRDEN